MSRCTPLWWWLKPPVLPSCGVAVLVTAALTAVEWTGVTAQTVTVLPMPRTIQVVVDNDYPPFSFRSSDGRLQGLLIDQWRAWENQTGIKAEIHGEDWATALQRMRGGEFDVIDCIFETAQRRNFFDFTPAYTTIEASIFFRDDISGITDLASLKGFPVGVKAGDQHIDTLKENGVTTVIPFQSYGAVVDAARQRKINVFVVDDLSAFHLLSRRGIDADFRHSAPMFRDELRRAVRKGNEGLLRTVSEGFAAIDRVELKRIDEKWFGRPIINRIGRYVTYAGYAGVAAVMLIAGLTGWNRTLRKKILQRTAALGESEQRFRQIAENIRDVFWLATTRFDGSEHSLLYISPAYTSIWGRSCESLYREPRSFIDAIHPEDRAHATSTIERDREQGLDVEFRVVRPDGSIRWIRDRGFPIKDESGRCYRVAGIAEDITERKQSEETLQATRDQLRALAARLQTVREDERTRAAREIHDELGQALTAVKLEFTALLRDLPAGDAPVSQRSQSIVKLLDRTIRSIRRIVTELRPGILDDLGLAAAVEWVAEEFETRTGTQVQVSLPRGEMAMDGEHATALFRILQETLTNVARHAGATEVSIRLAEAEGMLSLEVRDNGQGIAAERLSAHNSLGILGMQERALLLGGELLISGAPGLGTTVRVRIPETRLGPTGDLGLG